MGLLKGQNIASKLGTTINMEELTASLFFLKSILEAILEGMFQELSLVCVKIIPSGYSAAALSCCFIYLGVSCSKSMTCS